MSGLPAPRMGAERPLLVVVLLKPAWARTSLRSGVSPAHLPPPAQSTVTPPFGGSRPRCSLYVLFSVMGDRPG